MKNRLISTLLIICLTITMLMPMGVKPQEVSAADTFTVRTSMPKLTDKNAKYYYSDMNRFIKAGRLAPDFKYYEKIMDDGKTGGYVWGNCTWWAYSRASEVRGEMLTPELRGNAGSWYENNKKGKFYPYGQEPKVGAIVVYSSHVAFVEKIVDGQIYVSESGWQTKTYGPSSADDFYFHYGIPWRNKEKPKGYIYVTEKLSLEDIETVEADYSVKVSYDDLRMRAGPGTGYANKGYVSKGTHKLKAVTADGEWGQLASNGYWICLEYTEKVVVKSSNNKLSSITVGSYKITPEFDADTTSYKVTVPYEAESVVLSAKKEDSKASISGTGTKKPAVGENTYTIKVTAENGKVKNYTVKIVRENYIKVKVKVTELNMRTGPGSSYKSKGKIKPGIYTIVNVKNGWGKLKTNGYWISLEYTEEYIEKSGNNDLKSLTVGKRTLTPEFNPDTLSYSVTIPNDIVSIAVKAQKAHSKATVTGTGNKKPKVGTNTYKIKVTAENGKVKTYTVKIIRKAYKVKVSVKDLNMRTGPGTSYKTKGKIKPGTYTIVQRKNGWGKLKTNGYWIKLSYTKKVN